MSSTRQTLRQRLAAQIQEDQATGSRGSSESNPNGKFGEVKGYPVGSKFKDRKACFEAGVHGKTRAGIHGSRRLGAYSICLSGNYEDDEDDGDFIVYTGTGGQRDSNTETGSQITDQSFDHNDNAALKLNAQNGRPVRVIRKHCDDSPHAPQSGYRYDGLYKVERAYLAKGKHGFDVCRYQLRRLPGQVPLAVRPGETE
ncbi:PUA-like domain-containing protein [Coprinopsis sp. MPI-PUGE-AT-0042]|nr:PUA-like domain-containing protein [Coprinopsis sp. MPI-PUGE-AT-0042]